MFNVHELWRVIPYLLLYSVSFFENSENYNPPKVAIGRGLKNISRWKIEQQPAIGFRNAFSKNSAITMNVNQSGNIDLETARSLLFEKDGNITGLYHLPTCPFCKRVIDFCSQQSNKFQLKNLTDYNPNTNTTYMEELLRLTPNIKQVPALEIDEKFILRESSAILALLKEKNNLSSNPTDTTVYTDTLKTNTFNIKFPPPKEFVESDLVRTNDKLFPDENYPDIKANPGIEILTIKDRDSEGIKEMSENYVPQSDPYQESEKINTAAVQSVFQPTEHVSDKQLKSHGSLTSAPPNQYENTISKMVFVGNIIWNANSAELEKCMVLAGNVTDVSFIYNHYGRHKGCAIVTYNTADEAARAIKILNNTFFRGRKINVQPYMRFPRTSDPRMQYPHQFSNFPYHNRYQVRANNQPGFWGESQNISSLTKENYPNNIVNHNISRNVIFIWNLPNELLNDDLQKLFNTTGYIKHSQIVDLPDVYTNHLGIIVFSSEQEAHKAQKLFDKKSIYGRNIEVSMSSQNYHRNYQQRLPFHSNRLKQQRVYFSPSTSKFTDYEINRGDFNSIEKLSDPV